jgi:hypothetical protein
MAELRPCTLKAAAEFVRPYHRHSAPPHGGRFAIAALEAGEVVGVIVIGRPVARALDDGTTAEATRVCTLPGAPMGTCSKLMRAGWRAWVAMGGKRLVTYTLTRESGASLRGAGFRAVATVDPRKWNCPSRPRAARAIESESKTRWELAHG